MASDALNLNTITCGENGEIKFWPFKEKKVLNSCVLNYRHMLKLDESIDKIALHRDSGMLAVATDDFSVLIIDCDIKRVVRKFGGHSNRISDLVSFFFLIKKKTNKLNVNIFSFFKDV